MTLDFDHMTHKAGNIILLMKTHFLSLYAIARSVRLLYGRYIPVTTLFPDAPFISPP